MFSDIYESIHADDLGSTIGTFRLGADGLPVVELFQSETKERDDRAARASITRSRLKGLGDGVPADVLPGQEICKDNIIRHSTTSEAIGYDEFYRNKALNAEGRRVTIAEAQVLFTAGALINWRPDGVYGEGEYALVVGEDASQAVAA